MTLSPAMRAALQAMPITPGEDGCLPPSAPHAGTLHALERRGLARNLPGIGWVTTATGRREARQ